MTLEDIINVSKALLLCIFHLVMITTGHVPAANDVITLYGMEFCLRNNILLHTRTRTHTHTRAHTQRLLIS